MHTAEASCPNSSCSLQDLLIIGNMGNTPGDRAFAESREVGMRRSHSRNFQLKLVSFQLCPAGVYSCWPLEWAFLAMLAILVGLFPAVVFLPEGIKCSGGRSHLVQASQQWRTVSGSEEENGPWSRPWAHSETRGLEKVLGPEKRYVQEGGKECMVRSCTHRGRPQRRPLTFL